MGTAQGWETRRRREKLREKEWEDAIALAAREDERSRIRREMLEAIEACADTIEITGGLYGEADEGPVEMCDKEALLEALDRIIPPEEE